MDADANAPHGQVNGRSNWLMYIGNSGILLNEERGAVSLSLLFLSLFALKTGPD
jgi:hypothetical protein